MNRAISFQKGSQTRPSFTFLLLEQSPSCISAVRLSSYQRSDLQDIINLFFNSRRMFTALQIAILATITLGSEIGNDVEVNYGANFLPTDPMIIRIQKEDIYDEESPRIEYRGCHKFCVGRVRGSPGSDSVWNPYNQSTELIYYFRYVPVNMVECNWPAGSAPQILELFFEDMSYGNEDYIISRPADKVTPENFYFLVYNPDTSPNDFRVRWTAYMNACNETDTNAPIQPHFEKNAFDPSDYVPVFQGL